MNKPVQVRLKLMLRFLPFSSPSLERQTPYWLGVVRKPRILFYSSTLRLLTLFSDVVLEILRPISSTLQKSRGTHQLTPSCGDLSKIEAIIISLKSQI